MGVYGPATGFPRGWVVRGSGRNGRAPAILSALAARLRRQPIEFAVETVAVRGQGGRVAGPAQGQVTNLLRLAAPFAGFTTAALSARHLRRRLSGTPTAALPLADSANGASYAQRTGREQERQPANGYVRAGCVRKWRVDAPQHRRTKGHQSRRRRFAAAVSLAASGPASASASVAVAAAAASAVSASAVAAASASVARWRVPCFGHRAIRVRC
eukprot:scaffold20432_cov70-Phaeocystis_antarctica.AAC.3